MQVVGDCSLATGKGEGDVVHNFHFSIKSLRSSLSERWERWFKCNFIPCQRNELRPHLSIFMEPPFLTVRRKALGVSSLEPFLAPIDPKNSIPDVVPEKSSLSFPLFRSF